MVTLLDTARATYKVGLCVLPVCEDGSKRPAVGRWVEFKTQRPTVDDMRGWDFGSRHGLGIIAGAVSRHRECWDFDHLDTFTAFVAAADACGLGDVVQRIRDGYEDETPAGGRRWIVGYPEGVTFADVTLAARPLSDGTVKTLIELPTFAIIAPSDGGVHPSGRPYVRRSGGPTTIATYTADERDALLALARSFDERPKRAAHEPRTTAGSGRRPGDLFNERAAWVDVLAPHFHSPRERRDGTVYWWRAGKAPGASHAATTNHGGSNLLYVFSSSTPLEADHSYTKFGAFAFLHHGGNFEAAGRALWEAGYRDADAPPSSSSPATGRTTPHAVPWPAPLAEAGYYGLFGTIVQAIAPHSESDPIAILLQLLVMFGSVIGRSAYFRVEATVHFLNEFLVLVGQSSKARKGTSYGYGEALYQPLDPAWKRMSGLSSGEGLIWPIHDAIVRQVKGQPVTDDPGITDKRLLVFESELASTLHAMERPGNRLGDVMKDAWDGRDLNSMTKNSPACATKPHIAVVSHITINELTRLLTQTEMSNGWANRFLLACVKRSKALPLGGQAVDLTAFRSELGHAMHFAKATEQMAFDRDAETLWCRVYEELSADRPGLLGSMTARAEAHTRRLACLFALSDMSGYVAQPHLEAALAVWRYVFDSVAYVFGDSLGDPQADAILSALRQHPDGMTRTAIRDLFSRNQTADVIRRALELLEALRLARKVLETTDGRSVERWFAV